MKQHARNVLLISWTLILEAWRRREVYAIVIVTVLLLGALRFIHFFDLPELAKFYREISLKVMNITTGALVIILAARQLPREFQYRTIYPLLAKPISRLEFLGGKYLGVLAAGVFCYFLFMLVFLFGSMTLARPVNPGLFAQSVYLQILSLAVIAALTFLLSMLLNMDAAITIAGLLFISCQVLMNLLSYLYDYVGSVGKIMVVCLHYIIPQLTLFDASAKVVHSVSGGAVVWSSLPAWAMVYLTGYAGIYVLLYSFGTYVLFRRKPL